MNAVNLASNILDHWEKVHPDVPWINQTISIKANEKNESINFWKILIQGGSGNYKISTADVHGKEIDDGFYALSWDSNDSAIIIIPKQSCPTIKEIKVQQLGSPQLAKILCFEKPADTDDALVIFNSRSNEKRLLEYITFCLQHQSNPIAYSLLKALHALVNNQKNDLLKHIESKSPILKKNPKIFNNFLNRYQLEHNAHGVKRTFRFWSFEEKNTYLREVAELIDYLSALSPNKVALGFGAVLGKYREDDLIAHDDDIDVILAFDHSNVSSIASALSILSRHLKNTAWEVQGHFFSHLWVGLPCGYRVDVFVGLIEINGKLSFYPSARHSLEAMQIFPPVKGSLVDVELPFPAEPEPYLERTYGTQWKTPLVAFAHPWDRSQYTDIAGQHVPQTMTTRGEMATHQRRTNGL